MCSPRIMSGPDSRDEDEDNYDHRHTWRLQKLRRLTQSWKKTQRAWVQRSLFAQTMEHIKCVDSDLFQVEAAEHLAQPVESKNVEYHKKYESLQDECEWLGTRHKQRNRSNNWNNDDGKHSCEKTLNIILMMPTRKGKRSRHPGTHYESWCSERRHSDPRIADSSKVDWGTLPRPDLVHALTRV